MNVEKLVGLGTAVCSTCYHFPFLFFAPCKVIRIPESRKFLLVESGILGSGIQNPAFGIQDPAKKGIQNPLECSSLTLSIGAQTELSNPTGFA